MMEMLFCRWRVPILGPLFAVLSGKADGFLGVVPDRRGPMHDTPLELDMGFLGVQRAVIGPKTSFVTTSVAPVTSSFLLLRVRHLLRTKRCTCYDSSWRSRKRSAQPIRGHETALCSPGWPATLPERTFSRPTQIQSTTRVRNTVMHDSFLVVPVTDQTERPLRPGPLEFLGSIGIKSTCDVTCHRSRPFFASRGGFSDHGFCM